MTFSYRKGIKKYREQLQIDKIEIGTRNLIWNLIKSNFWDNITCETNMAGRKLLLKSYVNKTFFFKLWGLYFREPTDILDNDWKKVYDIIRTYYFKCKWNEVYDFIEFLANNYFDKNCIKIFIEQCNQLFEQENIGYRFINKIIVDIVNETEVNSIKETLDFPLKPINEHLNSSLLFLCDRKNPDYRNSIKESISALESLCKIITKSERATLSDAIKIIDSNYKLHGSFKSAIEKLYGYTNDEKGIRHALMSETKINYEEAKFMLVTCSSLINYLISVLSKQGVNLF
jgi:hypothetical protein